VARQNGCDIYLRINIAPVFDSSKPTPGYAGGKKELIARGEVDKKKLPIIV